MLVTVLIGPPCCGKSTYLKSINYNFVISSDDIVNILCRQNGIAYHQYFKLAANNKLKRLHHQIFQKIIEESQTCKHKHVVWDLTNLSRKARAKIFKLYPNAQFNAVVFEFKGSENLLLARNRQRFKATQKHIDETVLQRMFEQYEPVIIDEGFVKITTVNVSEQKEIIHGVDKLIH